MIKIGITIYILFSYTKSIKIINQSKIFFTSSSSNTICCFFFTFLLDNLLILSQEEKSFKKYLS